MQIKLRGQKVILTNTNRIDLEQIIDFEQLNEHFVRCYSIEKHLSLLSDEDCLHLSILRIDNNRLVGHMILFGLSVKNKALEFRRLTINEKGSGYGRDAVKLLKKLCFEILKFHRLWLDVYDDNTIAINLYESEGFILEGTLRENVISGINFRSQRIYSILEHEYCLTRKSKC